MTNAAFAFLTVRTTSQRLPRKCFLPFGDNTVLEHAIFRTLNSSITPIVCTSDDSSDDEIELMCEKLGISFFRGSLKNKLLRWTQCAENFSIGAFHTIDVDDPFFDPKQVFESLELLNSKDLDFVSPTELSASGGASVGYSIKTGYLMKNFDEISRINDLEMIDSFFLNDHYARGTRLESKHQELNNVRLTLDYPEDLFLLQFVLQECGPFCDRKEITKLFHANPDLYKLNWFRNKEWAINQDRIRAGYQGTDRESIKTN
jgi:spore coat polysaccharide biosynthesis protein SpsF